MSDSQKLAETLRSLDGKGYRAYKQITGRFDFPGWTLQVDHIQGDPFADPSRFTLFFPSGSIPLSESALHSLAARVAAADYLNRRLFDALQEGATGAGSGKSGELSILEPGQEILRRSSVTVEGGGSVEARIRIGMPARGRTILGKQAATLVCEALPRAVAESVLDERLPLDSLISHVQCVEDAQALRSALDEAGLVAFVADGAILPRLSGIDDRPLARGEVIPFESPPELRVELSTPHSGMVPGMGVPIGITLLAGGGFHGKSTLLRAIQRGMYDHLPGDGRERVVTRADAVKVRAEDGRAVHGTDISGFITNLPTGDDTARFHTENASGSTSQSAAIAEALELGCTCLLIDEDTSATNFLIRDARVQALIEEEDEPITPFIDRISRLREEGISTVLVVGGSGDFFDLADTVIAMRAYRPREVTDEARSIVKELPTRRRSETESWSMPQPRRPEPGEIRPRRGRHEVHFKAYSPHRLAFGTGELDLSAVEQLVESAQTRAIARALAWGRESCIDAERNTLEALSCVMEALRDGGIDQMDDRRLGDYAEFRIFELGAVLNRLR